MFKLTPAFVLCSCLFVPGLAGGQIPPRDAAAEPPPLEGGTPAPEPPVPAAVPPAQDAAVLPPSPSPTPAGAGAVSPCPPAPPPESSEAEPASEPDHDAVFRAFAVYAASERDRRIVGAVAGVTAGVTTMVLGATIAEPTGTDPTVWYVVGGVTAGLSLLGALLPSPAEVMARSFRVKDVGHTPSEARALEIRWNDYAQSARNRRIGAGVTSVLVSAVAIGGGIAIATGAGDFSDSDRYFWSTFLIATGGAVGVTGLAGIFIKSPAERSFEAYRAARPEGVALSPVLVGGPGGVFVGARGAF